MFDYLNKKRHFTIKLGQIISHEIVKSNHSIKSIRKPDEINQMDRFNLAYEAISKMPIDYLTGDYEKKDLIKDTAVYIDKRIPQSFAKWTQLDHSKGPTQMKINATDYGLTYQFEENLSKNGKLSPLKQVNQVNTKVEKPIKAKTPKTTNEPSGRTDKEIKDENYQQLIKYIKNQNKNIKSELFKAMLFTMNGMTIYNQTKQNAIKKATSYYDVTQKSIKEHIDNIGIISKRAMENANNFKRELGRQNGIAINQLKNRLIREVD